MFEEENLVEKLVPAVREQLESKETPFVKETMKELLQKGTDKDEAEMMIALCLADEVNRMFIDKRVFDTARYKGLLDALPELPEA